MRCFECGSIDIGLDKNNNKYCRECGAILEGLDEFEEE
jgi:transcription initiation factor TFIIIB Brf1 subunit/transcription initiation factor TFIIB